MNAADLTPGTLVNIVRGKHAGMVVVVRSGSKGGTMLTVSRCYKVPAGWGISLFKCGSQNVELAQGPLVNWTGGW
jgi:hypothetical protein